MSVLLEFSMFPTEGSEGKSASVAKIVGMIAQSGYPYKLTPMSTVVETPTLPEALSIIEAAYELLEEYNRVYGCFKVDIRKNRTEGMVQKIASVEEKLGYKVVV